MTVHEKQISVEEFLRIAQLPENANRRLELVDGVIFEMPPSSQKNALLASWIAHLLWIYLATNKLGIVTGPDGGYRIGASAVFQPDVAFIRKDRAGDFKETVCPVAPDLAVEIISPSETARAVHRKAQAYLEAGTHMVWAVYPDDRAVEVFTLADNGDLRLTMAGKDKALDGGTVLPGLSIQIADIFVPLAV